jgi:hypothetical protein
MKRTATVAEWFKTHGKHPVYAKNQSLPLPDGPSTIVLRDAESTRRRRLPLFQ